MKLNPKTLILFSIAIAAALIAFFLARAQLSKKYQELYKGAKKKSSADSEERHAGRRYDYKQKDDLGARAIYAVDATGEAFVYELGPTEKKARKRKRIYVLS